MKVIAIVMAGLLPIAAHAEDWKVYRYPEPGFAVQFPADPVLERGTIRTPSGVSLPVTRYTVRQDRLVYTVSVVDYSGVNSDSLSTIAQTERTLRATGTVTRASGARVNRSFGRALTIDGKDGSLSAIAIFFVDKHLYTVTGQALPPGTADTAATVDRFRQSLRFPEADTGFGLGGLISSLFGGGGADSGAAPGGAAPGGAVSGVAVSAAVAPSGGGAAGGGAAAADGGRPAHDGVSSRAEAACTGKAPGDAVQLETPAGPVAATCTLVARPNAPAP